MIEGINVLEQTEIMINPNWVTILFAIALVCIFGGLLSCLICALNNWQNPFNISFGVMIIGLIMFTINIICEKTIHVPTGRYRYEVLIEEDASFKEIYNNYNIIEHGENIYTIEDKEK